jgi:hypothetical protein
MVYSIMKLIMCFLCKQQEISSKRETNVEQTNAEEVIKI